MSILFETKKGVWELSIKNGIKRHDDATILLIAENLEEKLKVKFKDNKQTLAQLLRDEEKLMKLDAFHRAYNGRWESMDKGDLEKVRDIIYNTKL